MRVQGGRIGVQPHQRTALRRPVFKSKLGGRSTGCGWPGDPLRCAGVDVGPWVGVSTNNGVGVVPTCVRVDSAVGTSDGPFEVVVAVSSGVVSMEPDGAGTGVAVAAAMTGATSVPL